MREGRRARLRFGLFLLACMPRCVLDCLRTGYGWRNALRWTVAGHWACWRMTRDG